MLQKSQGEGYKGSVAPDVAPSTVRLTGTRSLEVTMRSEPPIIQGHRLAGPPARSPTEHGCLARGWAFSNSHEPPARAPTEGANPLVSLHTGECFPRGPLVRIPRGRFRATACWLRLRTPEPVATFWRRGWDSNPRSRCRDACFPSMSIRPLSHLSARGRLRSAAS